MTLSRPSCSVREWAARLVAALATACIESPQELVEYEAVAVPDPEPSTNAGGWTIRLARADVAFGPVYFCAASSGSSTLCASSIAEVTEVARIDGLDRVPQRIGTVRGLTGSIRSASYDFGLSWFTTQNDPTAADVAPSGHSMRLEGEAQRDALVLPIVADVDLVPQYQGQMAVPTAPAEATIESSAYRLEVSFRAADWFRQLDLDEIAASGASAVVIVPGTPEHNALLVGIKNLAPLEFRWVRITN
jgi:hypothetical protein